MQKSFGVVKKRLDKEESVDFRKFNIEELLLDIGIEFRNPNKAVGGWLPLEAFDNKELDSRAPKDWVIVKRKGNGTPPGRKSTEEDVQTPRG